MRSLGKKPHFGAFPEAQKGVLICAICLRKAAHWPNNNANPSGLSEKTVYCVESLRFVDKVEKTPFWGLPSGPKKLKKLTGALGCMHKAPNAFNPFGAIRKKFLLCKSTKKARYVRSLGKKPHFGAFPEAQKGVLICTSVCARLRTGPIIMQIPRGYQKKQFIV